jgi:hypothetical protein
MTAMPSFVCTIRVPVLIRLGFKDTFSRQIRRILGDSWLYKKRSTIVWNVKVEDISSTLDVKNGQIIIRELLIIMIQQQVLLESQALIGPVAT